MLLLHPAVKIVPHLMFIHILALRWTEVLRSSLTTGNWGVLYMLSSIASVADLFDIWVVCQRDRGWRTFKRPGVEAFLEQLALHYELVIYSHQLGFVSEFFYIFLFASIVVEGVHFPLG